MKFIKIELPEQLANELKNINWERVTELDIKLLIEFARPFLKLKGIYKQKENKK
ncbi:MAG: hypothetical protein AB1695_14245 [Stygiobacter sp.]